MSIFWKWNKNWVISSEFHSCFHNVMERVGRGGEGGGGQGDLNFPFPIHFIPGYLYRPFFTGVPASLCQILCNLKMFSYSLFSSDVIKSSKTWTVNPTKLFFLYLLDMKIIHLYAKFGIDPVIPFGNKAIWNLWCPGWTCFWTVTKTDIFVIFKFSDVIII